MRSERPNLVLITADQYRGDCLTGSGTRHPVMTPHLTQLGFEGTRFANAYADCPVCMPQRVTQMTGQAAGRFGLRHNFGCRSPLDRETSLPGRLAREAGYQTQAVGKMHVEPSRMRFGFDHIDLHPNDYINWLEEKGYGGQYRGHGLGGNEVYPAVSAVPEAFTHTHWAVDRAVEFLGRRDPECPFFLWIVFEAPHSPFDPPEPFDRMYDNFTIPDPVQGDWEPLPEFAQRATQMKYDQLSPEMVRESRRRYYGQVSHIDYQLGRFFGELRTRGLYDDTAICFTADHGEHLGDHGVWAKGSFLHGGGDVPLLLKLPRDQGPPARVSDRPALTADICPTFLELAGLPAPAECDGESLLSETMGEDAGSRTICGEFRETAFACDEQYKYVWFALGGRELLFDIREDRENLHDLSRKPELKSVKAGLRASLVDYLIGFDSPLIESGDLRVLENAATDAELRGRNPFANRGPMRYGQGYQGWKG